jgi:hypothetical protein
MPQQIHHKKNEIQDVELFEDKECTEAFDFMDKKDLYIELVSGDITPLVRLRNQAATWQNIYTPYLCEQFKHYEPLDKIKTLDDINLNLSKYIPKDNAVLFLTQEDTLKYSEIFKDRTCAMLNKVTLDVIKEKNTKKLTIFLPHGTQSELQKANEVAKELKEKYGVEEVNLFALHCFIRGLCFINEKLSFYHYANHNSVAEVKFSESFINKIITTNSTGILKPEDSTERLQVIDAKEMLEEYLNENNLI